MTPQLRSLLNESYLSIVVGPPETKGLALAETWSMDVPTLVFRLKNEVGSARAPYLTNSTGAFWSSLDELEYLIVNFREYEFSPRA